MPTNESGKMVKPYLNEIVQGDCIEVMRDVLEPASVDLVFADPPYDMRLGGDLLRPDGSEVAAVNDEWDKIGGPIKYRQFTLDWLAGVKRVLKPTGALWVSGSYHNIYLIGAVLVEHGWWIRNDVVWVKRNPMPQMRGVRFCNAHETLIWAQPYKHKYTFNYQEMKRLNHGKQARSDWWLDEEDTPDIWNLSICQGAERLKGEDGKKAHSTQKPESLLERVIRSTTNPGDIVLDPFFGSGTTGAVAKRLGRNWLGIEREYDYCKLAQARIDRTEVQLDPEN